VFPSALTAGEAFGMPGQDRIVLTDRDYKRLALSFRREGCRQGLIRIKNFRSGIHNTLP
jgi:hypothetical protein